MGNRIAGVIVALALTAPTAVVATSVAADAAAPKYRSCDALTRDFPHGVAKSRKAARRQVRDGNGRPAFGKRARAIYWENRSNLDRDKDGTACEG